MTVQPSAHELGFLGFSSQSYEVPQFCDRSGNNKIHGQFLRVLPDGEVCHDVNEDNCNSLALKSTTTMHKKGVGEGDGAEDVVITKLETRDFLDYVQELNKIDGVYKPESADRGSGLTVNFVIQPGRREKQAVIDVPSEIVDTPRSKKTFALMIGRKGAA